MSSKIDERVVKATFDNAQFEKGVAQTNKSLDDLKKNLNLNGAAKGLQDVDAAARNLSLAGIGAGVETLISKFGSLSVIAITALANIANRAVDAGITLVKSLTVDPVAQGLKEYETQLNAIQTILANTQSKGTTLDNVNAALAELNRYADLTIYNFSEMTRNIGTFTAAGVDLDTSVKAIKGIANLAAVSGSSADQASTAMYQLSQALATGTVKLMDWNSVVNAGMGGQFFQDALKETARVHGVAVDQIIQDEGSFRDSLQKGWLTSQILTETLAKFTGDLNDDQLRTMGYTEDQIVEIQKMAKTAQDAATKIKTGTQLINTLQEAVGSGWAQTWQIVFGDFEEAKNLFSGIYNVISPLINASAQARNALLEGWKDNGGRDAAIQTFYNLLNLVLGIMKPIKAAFEQIFPPATGEQLANITKAIEAFTAKLIPTEETAGKIQRTFAGLFAVLNIGWMIIKQIIDLFVRLLGVVAPAGGSILDFTANLGDFLVKVRDAIKNGEGLGKVFDFIGNMLEKPLALLTQFIKFVVGSLFSIDAFTNAWKAVANALKAVWNFLKPVVDWFISAFKVVQEAVHQAFEGMDFNILVGLLNTGLLAGVFIIIKKFLDNIPKLLGGIGGGIFDTIKGAFTELTNTMQTMQEKLKADILLKIAIAIGVLTAAVVALSFVDTGKMFIALGAIATMGIILGGFMVALDTFVSSKAALKMPFIAAGLTILAVALDLLSIAVVVLGKLSWEEIARGLVALAGAMTIITIAANLLPPNLALSGAGLLVASVGIVALAAALKIMSTLSWDDIGRSLVVLGGSLVLLAAGLIAMTASLPGAAALLVASVGLIALAAALKIMATLSWDDIGRIMVVLGGSLVLLAIGLTAMVAALPGAAALVVASAGLIILAGALKLMGMLSWDEIGKAMVTLGGSLLILAVGLTLMIAALPGAAALVVASAALAVLVPVLFALGSMSWDQIGTGLGALASVLGILAAAGILLIPAIPGLVGLGIAIALVGLGALAAGAGLLAFSIGLTTLSVAGQVGVDALKVMLQTIISLIPDLMATLAQGIINFALVLANGGAAFTAAMTTLLQSLITAIQTLGPQIIDVLFQLVLQMVQKLKDNVPLFVDAGLQMITGILNAIAANMNNVITAGTNVIIAFITGVQNNLNRVIDAGIETVIRFVNGLANSIRDHTDEMRNAGLNLANAILNGMTGGLWDGVGRVIDAARNMAENVINAAMDALGAHSPSRKFIAIGGMTTDGFAIGIDDGTSTVVKSAENMGNMALYTVKKSISKIADAVAMDMDSAPTIRPVLDLSAVKKDAGLIGGLLTPPTLKVDNNYATAASLSAAVRERNTPDDPDDEDGGVPKTGDTYNFVQNNTSPKALSNAELYRQSKNLISMKKEELSKNATG